MLMVSLDDPLDEKTVVGVAKSYLEQCGYDLALLDTREVRIVYRERLRDLSGDALSHKSLRTPPPASRCSPRSQRSCRHAAAMMLSAPEPRRRTPSTRCCQPSRLGRRGMSGYALHPGFGAHAGAGAPQATAKV